MKAPCFSIPEIYSNKTKYRKTWSIPMSARKKIDNILTLLQQRAWKNKKRPIIVIKTKIERMPKLAADRQQSGNHRDNYFDVMQSQTHDFNCSPVERRASIKASRPRKSSVCEQSEGLF
jgi:hypothetical protein